jgi:peptidyl-prolyl cis-trans isomerase D
VPEKVKARQILLKVAPDATAAVKAEVKQRAENLRKDLVDNKKPFADVAKGFSDDLETKEKGGELGLVERLQLPAAFADALFALNANGVTAPVETPMGFFIGTVEEKQAAQQRTLEQVKTEIATQLFLKEKSKAIAKTEADKAMAELKKGKTLAELFPADAKPADSNPFGFGQDSKPTSKDTAEFNSSADAIPSLGAAPEVMKAVFAKKDIGLLDQAFVVGDAITLVDVTERKVASDAAFEQEKDKLTLEAVKGKQFEVREAFLKSLKQSGTVTTNDKAVDKIVGSDS